jgi:hypothetical protein
MARDRTRHLRPVSATTKGRHVAQQPARAGIRAGQALGLTVFLATAAFLTALLLSRLGQVFDSLQTTAAAFSTFCAVVAAFAMLIDAADLWVRGRKMSPYAVKMFRSLVFIAVLGALAASLIGKNSLVIPLLVPAMIVYLFIARKRPAARYATAPGGARGAAATRPASSGSTKSRQRKGGKKHR